jgi:RNA polymerase sigma-70 factor, ECF subfamily
MVTGMALFRRSHAEDAPSGDSRLEATVDGSFGLPDGSTQPVDGDGRAKRQIVQSAFAQAGVPGATKRSTADILGEIEAGERERRREQRLVEAACRGEHSAIEALYRTHFDTIYRYVFLRLGSPAAAEDVTSQVFLGMIRGLGRYHDEGKPFVAWLYAMARKQVAFYQRGQSRAPGAVDLEAAEELVAQTAGPHATAEERELRVAIAHALAKVPEGQREVIMLRYILSMSIADTAAAIGRTEGAVKQLQLRGLATLKTVLSQQGAHLL